MFCVRVSGKIFGMDGGFEKNHTVACSFVVVFFLVDDLIEPLGIFLFPPHMTARH
jgi:hypothetical protein